MSPDLSPDGTHLVYGVNGSTLHIKDLDSDDAARALEISGNSPRYSPDGTQIAFATSEAIRIMDAEGDNVQDVITGELSYLSSVDWLADGARLAITSENGVEIVDIEAGSRRTIADGFATKDIDVSADGERLVYGVNGQESLTIINGL
jgi:Tol biopolymer transport system component